jgi:hypothetical protein
MRPFSCLIMVSKGWSEEGLKWYNELFKEIKVQRKTREQRELDRLWMEGVASEREAQAQGKRKRKIFEMDADSAYNCVVCDTGCYSDDEDETTSAATCSVTVASGTDCVDCDGTATPV